MNKKLPYSDSELFSPDIRDTYTGPALRQCAFPLGGIGTGCISLSGTGHLVDWEIFNEANKGFEPWMSFLSLWTKQGDRVNFKVLEGQLMDDLHGRQYVPDKRLSGEGYGIGPHQLHGKALPRFRECQMVAQFPFAKVILEDPVNPLRVEIEGWSPFIPGNAKDSSIPVAILNVTLTNPTNEVVDAAVGINLENQVGKVNELIDIPTGSNHTKGLFLHGAEEKKHSEDTLFIISPQQPTTSLPHWPGLPNFSLLEFFRRTFASTGEFSPISEKKVEGEQADWAVNRDTRKNAIGSMSFAVTLEPGASTTIPIVIGWYFPRFKRWRHWYGMEWDNGQNVARYVVENLSRLQEKTRAFQNAFFASTLPGVVLEAASTNLSILRTPTVIRYPEGTLYGWEGCLYNKRLGEGTCNHVWHYQWAVPYLFPDLQRLMLENFLFNGLNEGTGAVKYRMPVEPPAHRDPTDYDEIEEEGLTWADVLNRAAAKQNYFTAADGQLGQVCQVFRDWQIAGDHGWLERVWPRVKKALEYAWVEWDQDKDGLLEGKHHTTLDLNLFTPDSWCGSIYLAALLAGEQMARAVGDADTAAEYREVFERGRQNTETRLFNGRYYHQQIPVEGTLQYGSGCEIDQVHGHLYAKLLGLEDILNPAHIRAALSSLFENNYHTNFYDFFNTNRVYAVGDDRGLIICSWPDGSRPDTPLLYCDEVMEGFEYQAANNMILAGLVQEGLTVIKSIRDRYDGKKRNPFCEFEWGNHYARSMASYAGILALSGWRYSGPENAIWLRPLVNQTDFNVFFSVDGAWGNVILQVTEESKRIRFQICLEYGQLSLQDIHLPEMGAGNWDIALNGEIIAGDVTRSPESLHLHLAKLVTVKQKQDFVLELKKKE